jgi:recombinational DNA repair protein RecT
MGPFQSEKILVATEEFFATYRGLTEKDTRNSKTILHSLLKKWLRVTPAMNSVHYEADCFNEAKSITNRYFTSLFNKRS